jgi:hypothetical protein
LQLLDLASNYAAAEPRVAAHSWVAEHPLADVQLCDEGVLVLGIRRSDGSFLGAPRDDTRIHESDPLTQYGFAAILEDLGTRRVGMQGDRSLPTLPTWLTSTHANASPSTELVGIAASSDRGCRFVSGGRVV